MVKLSDLTDLRTKVERLQRESDRAAGALTQALKRLKDEFQCSSLEDAEKKLKELKKEEAKAKDAFDESLTKFTKDWPDVCTNS